MCYSAQIQAAYLQYLRETGAEMDIDQFVEIFGARVSDSSIRIPRAVERWFDEPEERRRTQDQVAHRPIPRRRDHQARARGVRAEEAPRRCRAHAGVEADQGRGREQAHRHRQDREGAHAARSAQGHQAAPGRGADLSAALRAHRHAGRRHDALMRLARYHCRKPGEPAFVDRKLPGLYNARRDSLGKYWKGVVWR